MAARRPSSGNTAAHLTRRVARACGAAGTALPTSTRRWRRRQRTSGAVAQRQRRTWLAVQPPSTLLHGPPNTGDKLRSSNTLRLRLLHPLVRRPAHSTPPCPANQSSTLWSSRPGELHSARPSRRAVAAPPGRESSRSRDAQRDRADSAEVIAEAPSVAMWSAAAHAPGVTQLGIAATLNRHDACRDAPRLMPTRMSLGNDSDRGERDPVHRTLGRRPSGPGQRLCQSRRQIS